MKHQIKFIPFVQAGGLTAYVALIGWFMQNAEHWFGQQQNNKIFGTMTFLLLFVISALISASIMLAYPAMLFFRGKRITALKVILQSVGWLFLFLILIIIISLNK